MNDDEIKNVKKFLISLQSSFESQLSALIKICKSSLQLFLFALQLLINKTIDWAQNELENIIYSHI